MASRVLGTSSGSFEGLDRLFFGGGVSEAHVEA